MSIFSNYILRIIALLVLSLIFSGCSRGLNKARIRERAEKYFRAGEYDKAKVEYLNLLRADGQSLVAIERLGLIWIEQGASRRSIPFFIRARELAPQDVSAWSKLPSAYMAAGDFPDARKAAVALLQKDPTSSDAVIILCDASQSKDEIAAAEQQLEKFPQKDTAAFHLAAASLATKKGEASEAAEQMQQAVAAEPKSAQAHLRLGYFYLIRGNPSHAESELKAAADLAPARSEERIKYAEYRAANGGADEAKNILTGITKQTPDYLPAWRDLAQIALTEKKYDEGLSMLENILSRDAENPEARLLQATFFMGKGDSAKAIAILRKISDAYPSNPLVKFQLARAYSQNNNIAQAAAALEQAISVKPDYAEALIALAEINLRTGKVQPAVGSLEDLLRKHPNVPQAETLLVSGYQALGRLDDAAAICRKKINEAPQSADGYYMLGLILHQQQKDAEAKQALEKAATLAPDNFNALDKLVELDLTAKRYDSATQRVEQRLQKNPNAPGPHYLEAKIYLVHGTPADLGRAESALRKTLELDSNFMPAYDLLISVYVTQEKTNEALNELKAGLAKDPNNSQALLLTALIYERAKDYARAREFYEKSLAANGDSILALNNLAYLYTERFNEVSKGYELAQKAHNLQPANGMVEDTLGWILYKRGDYQQALTLLQDSASKFPDNPEVQFHLGMAQYMMGNTDAARPALEKSVHTDADYSGKDEAARRLSDLEKATSKRGVTEPGTQSPQSNDLIALLREADEYQKQGDALKAGSTYERAFKANPKLASTAVRIAQLNSGPLHQPNKALEFARKARDLAPNDPQVGAAVGTVALQCDKFDWAYSLLQESTRRGVGDPAVLHDLAMATYALGRVSDARQTMQKAMEAKPTASEAEDGKRFLTMTSSTLPTQAEIENVLKGQPDYVPAMMAQAAVELQHNNREKAASICQSVLTKYPDFAPAQKQLAAIYAGGSDKLKEAYDLAMKARKTLPDDPELARTLAEVSFKRNDFGYAAQLFQESAAKQPLTATDLYYLGMAQLQSRQGAKGRETLQQALAAGLKDPLAQDAKNRLAEQPAK